MEKQVRFAARSGSQGDGQTPTGISRSGSTRRSLFRENSSLADILETARTTSFAALVEAAGPSAYYNDFAYDSDDEESVTSPLVPNGQAQVRRMTPTQEYANAASMLCPMAACVAYLFVHPEAPLSVWLCAAGQWVHMPFSMLYHIQMARHQKSMCPIQNPWRVFDQMFIHVAAAFWTFALSGEVWYGSVVTCMCVLYICWLWRDYFDGASGRPANPGQGGAPGRRHSIAMMVILYLAPAFLRGDYIDAGSALGWFVASAFIFVTYPFGGYSHCFFHMLLFPYQWCILLSATKVDKLNLHEPFSPSGSPPVSLFELGLLIVLTLCFTVRHCAKYQ